MRPFPTAFLSFLLAETALQALPPMEIQFNAFSHRMADSGFPASELRTATLQLALFFVDREDYHFAWTFGVAAPIKASEEVLGTPYGYGGPVIQQNRRVYEYRPWLASSVQFLWGDRLQVGIAPELRFGNHRYGGTWHDFDSEGEDSVQAGGAFLVVWAPRRQGLRLGLRAGAVEDVRHSLGVNRELGFSMGWRF